MFNGPSNVPGGATVVVGSAPTLAASALDAIGEVQTAIGLVTVIRADGMIVHARGGDLVYRGDSIETGTDGAIGITFIDGTAFNLSAATRLVLNDFVCERSGTPNFALFRLVQGAFSFVAGKLARARGLNIDTPFGTIRGAARERGTGIVTLAALTFAAIKESEAASGHDTFLDDGTITYKDTPHGTFEIVTRDGRVVVADDPGETVVVDPAGNVARIPNSSSRMADLQSAQQNALATLSLGQQGAAPGGSSTQTFDIPLQLQPINFFQLQNNGPTTSTLASITTTTNQPSIETPVFKPPSPSPVFQVGSAGPHATTEVINTTGSDEPDTASANTVTFTDFELSTVSASLGPITWSGGTTLPSSVSPVLADALSITTNRTSQSSGSITATFSATDNNFDFLAAGETLVIVYNVTLTDNNGNSFTQPMTIIVTGTNDAPALAADPSGPQMIAKHVYITGSTSPDTRSGTLTFTDVDLNDNHRVSVSAPAFASSGAALTGAQQAALAAASTLTFSEIDSTHSGAGSIAFSYSAADNTFDFLPFGQTVTITYNVTVTDNNGASSTQPVTITVTGTDEPPVLGNVAATASYTQNNPAVTLSSALTVSDVDNLNLHSAEVSISSGFLTGDVLSATVAGTSIAASYDATTGVLTLTGNDTLAHYQQVLDSITYNSTSTNPTNFDTDSNRTISWVINDGTLNSATATTTLSITALNNAPVATITPTTYNATEQVSLNLKNSGLSVSDVDSLGGVETVTLSVAEGTLTVAAGSSGATVQGSGTNTVTITGTLAQINALLNTDGTSAVSYIDNTDTPSASTTLTLSINDNGHTGTGGALTGSDTATINLTAVNDAPVATITPTTYNTTEQVSLNLKNSGLSVSDVDSLGGVETVTLSVTEGTLTVAAGSSGATVQGSGTNTVTITGTLAQINALLNTDGTSTVSYIDNSTTPSASTTLTLSVNDNGHTGTGGALTGSDTATINLTAVNNAPVATITPTTYNATEQVSLNLKNSGMSVSDVDSLGGVETVTLSVAEGTLTVAAGSSGATVQGSGTNTVTITGTLAQINALLNTDGSSTVSYIDNTDTPSASTTLTLSVNDNGNTGTGGALTGSDTATINLTAVNDAPVATITPTTYNTTEQVSLNLKNSGMSVSDVDSLGGVETVTLSVTEGTLTVAAGSSGATVQGSGTNTVTITGTLAQINALLNTDGTSTVSYIDNSTTPSASTTLTLSVNDNGHTGTGGALTGSDTATINLTAVNNAPVATITPTTYNATEQVSLNLKNSGMSVSDVDSLGGVETVTLSVTEGTLTVAAGSSGATVQGSGTNTVTITGTLAQINALLNTDGTSTVSYIDNTDTPSASTTLTLSVNDNGHTGTGGALTGSDTATINLTAVNDAPVATITPTTYNATEQVSLNLKNSGLSVSDVDSLDGVETVTLSVGEGTLTVAAGSSGATVQGSGTNTVTITGTLAQINALLNTDGSSTVSYIDNTDTPSASTTLTLSINDNGHTGTGGALTGSDTATINLTAVNDAPVATITPTTYNTTEQVSLNLKNSGLSVSDVDSLGGVETVTLSVTEGTLTVAAGSSGATVQGSGTNTVTITGTLAQINALLNTDGTSTVSYIDNSTTPSASTTLTLSVNDNGHTGTGGALTGSDTATINLTAVNNAPVATITPTTYNATEQVSLNLKNSGMSVSDVDSLGGVETVTLSVAEGTLTVAAGSSGATVQGSGTNTVTITGTLAQINALLNTDGTSTVSYIDNTDTPSASTTLTLSVNDNGNTGTGGALTGSDTATINLTAVNDAPVATITPTTYNATEQVSLNLKNSGLSVSDVDSLGGVETVTLSVTEGTLTVAAGSSGATVQGSGTNTVTITGTLAQINALLNTDGTSTVSYIDNSTTPSASTTLTLSVNDNGHTGTGGALTGSDTATINLTAVNDAPVATITPTTYNATEQVSLNLKNSGMSVSDVDSLGGVETVTLSVTEGTLTVAAGSSGATVEGSGTNTVTITGTLAQINALLNTDGTSTVSYIDNTDTPSASTTLTLSVNDNGHTGSGGALTGSDTATINLTAVNDAPVATITPTTYNAAGSLNLKNTGLSVSDVDSLGGIETVTLSVGEGTLTVAAGSSGATVQGSGTNTVTITGTLAQINALLNTDGTSTVSYIDNSTTPSASTTLTLSINDNGNTGTGGALTSSDTAIINISVLIAPGQVLTLKGGTLGNVENDGTIQTQSNNPSTILGSITGTGTIQIQNNTTLIIDGSVGPGQTVVFSVDPGGGANAKLVLNDPLHFQGKISDFLGGDQIDLGNFIVSSITYVDNAGTNTGGTLKVFGVFNGASTELDFTFIDGEKTTANFTFASDGKGGTLINDPPASTTTSDATAMPVVETTALTTTEPAVVQTDVSSATVNGNTAGTSQTNVSSTTVDDGAVIALNTAVAAPNGGKTTSVTFSKNATAAGSGSLMVNTAQEFISSSHRVAGILPDNGTVEVINPHNFARTTLARDRGAVTVLEGQIAIASTILVLEYLTEHLKLAHDGDGGTLVVDPLASPDHTVAAVAETQAVKTADAADTQTNPVAADDRAPVLDVALTPDGGMSDLTTSALPSGFALTDSGGDEHTATNAPIPVAYSESTDRGPHRSSKGHDTSASVATTNSGEGHTAAQALSSHTISLDGHDTSPSLATTNSGEGRIAAQPVPLNSQTISLEAGSDGNRSVSSSHSGNVASMHGNGGDAASIHSAVVELPSAAASPTAVEIPLATSDNSNFNSSAALPAAVEYADGGPAAPTVDTPATTLASNEPSSLQEATSDYLSDQPHFGNANDQGQSGNANLDNNGRGHQSHELPDQAASHADLPVTAGEDAKEGHAAHGHGGDASTVDVTATTIADGEGASVRGEPPGHANDQGQAGDANSDNNGRGHQSVAAVTIADGEDASSRGEPPGHGKDQAQSANANPDNNGRGHQSHESPNQATSQPAVDLPVTAGADAKDGHAAHGHGGDASTVDAAATIANSDAASVPGDPPGHGKDQAQAANANPDNNGLGHQSHESPDQATSQPAVDLPVTAGGDAKDGHAAHGHGGDSSTVDATAATIADSDVASVPGAPPGHAKDQAQSANANPDNNGLDHQSHELPNQAASHAAVEIPVSTADNSAVDHANDLNSSPPPTAVDDANGHKAADIQTAAAQPASTIDTPAATITDGDTASFRGDPPGHANDQAQSANANPDNNGLGHQSVELPNQAGSHAAVETPVSTSEKSTVDHANDLNASTPPTAVEDVNGHKAADIQTVAADSSSTIDASDAAVAHGNASGSQSAASDDQFHFAYSNLSTSQATELPSQAASDAAVEIPVSTTDNSAVDQANDLNSSAPPTAAKDANGHKAADIQTAATDPSSTIDTATVSPTDLSASQGKGHADMNDQFNFAYSNSSTSHPVQANSQPAVDVPAATTELTQTIDDILTQTAEAHPDPVTTPAQDHDLSSTNAHQDKLSVIHA